MVAALIKGFFLGLLLAISVGPIIFTIIKQSIKHGHKGGYAFIAGISVSDITLVLICNSFAALFASIMAHEKAIFIVGSAFLLILGVYALFFKKPATDNKEIKEKVFKKHELLGLFATGFIVNVINPGTLFFWFVWTTAILADSKDYPHPIQYRAIVFAVCLLVVFSTDVIKVLLAGKLRSKLTPKVMHRLDQILGAALIICGLVLLWKLFSHSSIH
ncbi:MAG: LysE family transporter [Chitinophagaceae bacterium]|nr:LysE family transporter [Chitinophagaceae bacterium]